MVDISKRPAKTSDIAQVSAVLSDAVRHDANLAMQNPHPIQKAERHGTKALVDMATPGTRAWFETTLQVNEAATEALRHETQVAVEGQRLLAHNLTEQFKDASRNLIQVAQGMSEDIRRLMTLPGATGERDPNLQQTTAGLVEAIMRTNLHAALELFRLSNPASLVELRHRLMGEYVDVFMQSTFELALTARGLADSMPGTLDSNADLPVPHPSAEQHVQHAAPTLSPKVQPELEKGRILVVDDDADVSRVTAAFLRKSGFDVTTVGNANEALTRLSVGFVYNALIADYAMPGMNGVDLIMQARELHPKLPALIITGHIGANGLGALPANVAILRKPFQRDELVLRVEDLIGNAMAAQSPDLNAGATQAS